ncbi:MAG: AsmA-like C-terminal region-containing protein [Polyangia bacterium]
MPAAEPAPSDASANPRRRRVPRALKVVLLSLAGLVGLVLVTLLVVGFAVDLGSTVRKQIEAQLPAVKKKIGREVTIGRVSLRLLPTTRLLIANVAVAAAPGQTGPAALPLVSVGNVRAEVELLPAIFTLGRRLNVRRVEIDGLRVNVARFANGRLSYEDVLEKLAEDTEPSKPLTPEEIDRLSGIRLQRAALLDGAVNFYDLSTAYGAATPLAIDQIELAITDAALFQPWAATLDLAALSSARNLHVAAQVAPMPRDMQIKDPLSLLRSLEVTLRPLQIEPLLRFVPPSPGIGLQKALVQASLKLETPESKGDLKLAATLGANGLVLESSTAVGAAAGALAQRRGQPADVSLAVDLGANMLRGDVLINKLELRINDMGLDGRADLRSLWSSPAVHALSLSSRGLLLERLLALLPPASLPADLVARGPLLVRASGSGTPTQAKVELGLDLTPAELLLPVLHKPAGTVLTFELRGQVAPKGVDLERLGLTLGPLALLLSGQVRSGDDFDLKLDSGKVDLDKLLRLLPTVAKATMGGRRKKDRIDGDLLITGTVKKKGEALDASARVKMNEARLTQEDVRLLGDADLVASVRSTPASASVSADLDLTRASLQVPGSVDKDEGVPMRLRLQAERTAQKVNIKLAQLELPGGTIRLLGSADLSGSRLDMKVPQCDLELDKLARVLPALQQGSLGGLLDSKLSIAVSVDGNPNKLATVHAKLDRFVMKVAGGTINGTAEVLGLDEPRQARFDFAADYLDLDRIFPASDTKEKDEPSKPASGSAPLPKFLRHLELDGKVKVAQGKLRGTAMRDFLLEVTMQNGKLILRTLRASALGGDVLASGSTVDVSGSKPRFALKAKLDRIDLSSVLALKSPELARKLSGRGNLDLSADGQGLAWEDIAPKLVGALTLGLTDGKFLGVGPGSQVVLPLIQRVAPQLATQTSAQHEMALRELAAHFTITDGHLQTKQPLRFVTEQGVVQLNGLIGLDKAVDLTGSINLSPQAIAQATGGRLVPDAPIPVNIRINGALTRPELQVVSIEQTVAALLPVLLKGKGGELLKNMGPLGNVLGGGQGAKLPGNLPGNLPANLPQGLPGNLPANLPQGLPQGLPQQGTTPQQPNLNEAKDRLKRGLGGFLGK